MKKKLLAAVITLSLILTVFTTPALAAVNGNAASPIPPRVENGVTLIPMRTVFEIFGATVDYDGATKKITADKNGTRITLILNSKKAYIKPFLVLLYV